METKYRIDIVAVPELSWLFVVTFYFEKGFRFRKSLPRNKFLLLLKVYFYDVLDQLVNQFSDFDTRLGESNSEIERFNSFRPTINKHRMHEACYDSGLRFYILEQLKSLWLRVLLPQEEIFRCKDGFPLTAVKKSNRSYFDLYKKSFTMKNVR